MRVVMTIAGSDSGAGAGIQADLCTFRALGVYGTTVVTGVTAQDTVAVRDLAVMTPDLVIAQIDTLLDDIPPDAIKIGMLGSGANVEAVASRLRDSAVIPTVLDPVLASTSGTPLLDSVGVQKMVSILFGKVSLVTPNLREAGILTGQVVDGIPQMEVAARQLVRMGAGSALVKGGHLEGGEIADVFFDGERLRRIVHRRHEGTPHGTGCVLSSAIAALLAMGRPIGDAVEEGIRFTVRAIDAALVVGTGTVCNPGA